jgi:hypothetical protein
MALRYRSAFRRWSSSLAFSCALFVSLFGCTAGFAASPEKAFIQADVDTVLVLDNAIGALSKPGANYSQILQRAMATLPAESQEVVRRDITRFLARAPAAGKDFKCGADFLRHRARQELLRLKDVLLEMGPQPLAPQVCYAIPFVVDLSRSSQIVDIYGFDLDQVPLEMVLLGRDGFQDVSFALTRKTHYHLTFDVDKQVLEGAPNRHILGLAWGHLIHYAIPLIQKATDLCDSRIEEIPVKTIDYSPRRIRNGGIPALSKPRIWGDIALDHESNKVDATFCIAATRQDGGDTYSGCGSEYVYTSEPERVIERVIGQLQSDIVFSQGKRAVVVRKGAQSGPVRQWTFAGFGGESGPGTKPQMTIQLRGLRVVSSATENCVSAIAYSEAKQANQLSRRTIERLDPQLGRIHPAILKLRPRFAPPPS